MFGGVAKSYIDWKIVDEPVRENGVYYAANGCLHRELVERSRLPGCNGCSNAAALVVEAPERFCRLS